MTALFVHAFEKSLVRTLPGLWFNARRSLASQPQNPEKNLKLDHTSSSTSNYGSMPVQKSSSNTPSDSTTASQDHQSAKERDTLKKKGLTVAERDAALMDTWKEREGSLANAELEDGELEGGYRRNVVSLNTWQRILPSVL